MGGVGGLTESEVPMRKHPPQLPGTLGLSSDSADKPLARETIFLGQRGALYTLSLPEQPTGPQVLRTQWTPGVNSLSPQARRLLGGGKALLLPLGFVLGFILERYVRNVILISNCSLFSLIPPPHSHRCTDTCARHTDTHTCKHTCTDTNTGTQSKGTDTHTETQVHRHTHARHRHR